MKLLLTFILLASSTYGQTDHKVSGIAGNGVVYTYQFTDIMSDDPISDIDTIHSEFDIVISETNKFINISGVKDIDSSFHFDSLMVEDLMKNEYLGEMMKEMNYQERREIDFEVDYIDAIIKGEYCPILVQWMYDELWNSMKLFVAFTQNGKSHLYSFYMDEVTYIGWEHGLMYSKEYLIDAYGETDARGEDEVDVFEANDEGTLVLNDTSMVLTTEKLNLSKVFTRCFNSPDENFYMVNGGILTIKKDKRWIFYSFDFDKERRAFDGYYFLGIKED